MTQADIRLLRLVAEVVDAIADGRAAVPLATDDPEVSEEVGAVVVAINGLINSFAILRDFSTALADGRIDYVVPAKRHILDSLKSLQSSLKHLTWQTQEVAAGNLNQRVDFLGDFSTAFNSMVEALREKRRVEREAMQARLASVGELAAGIAHEINTPVHYIGDNLVYIERRLPQLISVIEIGQRLAEEAPTSETAAEFREAAARISKMITELPKAVRESLDGVAQIARIVSSMKEFSHPGSTQKTSTDIHRALESTLTVSHNVWKIAAKVDRDFAPGLPSVVCHSGEINQVFLNLILNATQAIQSSGKELPGRIVIRTRLDGDTVEISFEDTGLGVPLALRERIFEPFFTTKPVGKGTGQGLAICRDVVVRNHGGTLEVGGEVGQGAIFTIRLPVCGDGGTIAAEEQ